MMYLQNEFLKHKESLNLNDRTLNVYEDYLNRFNAWMCDNKNVKYVQKDSILNIEPKLLQSYISQLKQKYSKSTVQLHFAVLKSYFAFLSHSRLIDSNPMMSVRIPKDKVRPEKRGAMTVADVESMITKITNPRDMAMVTMGFVLGMRREEISSIELRNIDIQNGTITFVRKGGEIQTLPIIESAKSAIQEQYRLASSKGHTYLFQSTHGRRAISPTQVFNVIKKYTEFAPHDLRRVACKTLNDKGVNISIIQKFMGHKSQTTTQLYINYSSNEVLEHLRGM